MSDSILAWHFVNKTLRDGSPIPKDGEWFVWSGPIEMCRLGLHASLHPFDALQYAPGSMLCRVECQGDMQHQDDKLVCRERRIVQRHEMEQELRAFAREQALSVVHLWNAPPAVIDYLTTGDETKRDAAWAAAGAAAWAAAGAAARAAARAAAWAAAEDAAEDAARAAARAAARSAWQDRVHRVFSISEGKDVTT